jgi:DNA recombination protein RmuC
MLEQSGMTRDREYSIQNSVSNEDGKRLIPDVVLHFPDERHVIVDSKVSLSAYNRSIEVTDEQMRKAALKENLLSVRKHVDELSKKDYSQVIEGTLDFTIMFMPIEGAYIAALQEDPQLWQYAYVRKIILISPTNLFAVLKLIDDLWSRDRQWKNAQEISRRGGLLLDKFVGFCQNMDKINDHLTKAQSAYNTAYGQLDNLKKQAHKLQELGIKSKNRLPQTEYQDE